MLFSSAIIATWALVQDVKPPEDWYQSTTRIFEFCVEAKFDHPLCPPLNQSPGDNREHLGFQISNPVGELTSENLFRAMSLYQMNKTPFAWLISLKLNEKKPAKMDRRLWAEAKFLYGRSLFDQKKYKEAEIIYEQLIDDMKGRALFHQHRAWIFFFNGKLDRALGSVVSAESPLIYPIIFFEKYFIRSLVERESCQWSKAFETIDAGRKNLRAMVEPQVENHPWVKLCDSRGLNDTCRRLRGFYDGYYRVQMMQALKDLDLVEIEMRDKGVIKPSKASRSAIVWPFVGESWADELGYYSVPVRKQCG